MSDLIALWCVAGYLVVTLLLMAFIVRLERTGRDGSR
jgi:hypothetical protein